MTQTADKLARILAKTGTSGARLRRAVVQSVSGNTASCLMLGDSTATTVAIVGMPVQAGDNILAVGTSGKWYGIGNFDRYMAEETQTVVDTRALMTFGTYSISSTGATGLQGTVTAPAVTGYTFLTWVMVSSVGFAGSAYVEYPFQEESAVYAAVGGTGSWMATAIYMRS